VLALGSEAWAQPAPLAAPAAWDAALQVGLLFGRSEAALPAGAYDDWFETPQVAVLAGRHLSTHLKLEIEASTGGEGQQFVPQSTSVPGVPYPVFITTERYTRASAVRASAVWQFLDNQWAHPFIHAGVAVAAERVRTRSWPPPGVSGRDAPTAAEPTEGPQISWAGALVVGGGAKLYVTTRLFARTDAQVTLAAGSTHVACRAGFGIDF
jgi:hypothetical protein